MGKLGNTTASAAECLEEYRRNRGKYLPMVDHEKRYFPPESEFGDVNFGWDCGFIGDRPYFLECWSPRGMTMLTVFVSTDGIGEYTGRDLERLLIEEGGIYAKAGGYMSTDRIPKYRDGSGNEFFSSNIVVGIGDGPAVISGGGALSPFRTLNRMNGYMG